ncbi:hypothetical protein BHE74_00054778 [Ensete ventricosum]|nr:hypothetical protein BHE74_00054778 [Ensete ventricosum]
MRLINDVLPAAVFAVCSHPLCGRYRLERPPRPSDNLPTPAMASNTITASMNCNAYGRLLGLLWCLFAPPQNPKSRGLLTRGDRRHRPKCRPEMLPQSTSTEAWQSAYYSFVSTPIRFW